VQIPLFGGAKAEADAPELRGRYPRNLVPVPSDSGVSAGYLRPAEGVRLLAQHAHGNDRGGINWRGRCYRVLGSKLCTVAADGAVAVVGDVGNDGQSSPVAIDYSFDTLGIVSNGRLFYATDSSVQEVTAAGTNVIDATFTGGYWMFADGEFIVVTDLDNPANVNPLKYGSSEIDPDRVVALRRQGDEVHVLNRHTVETFRNVGGTNFPFQVVPGTQVMKGCIGTRAACVYRDALAFVGGGRNEAPSIWATQGGQVVRLATREVEQMLEGYTEAQLQGAWMESRAYRAHEWLYLHLPDRTIVFDGSASEALGAAAWHTLDSGLNTPTAYRARGFVWCYEQWIVGDPVASRLGVMVDDIASHYGDEIGWEFGTNIIYNAGDSAILHELELVALPGRVAEADNPVVFTSYSVDGVLWSDERATRMGRRGDRTKRIVWLQQGPLNHWRLQRFRGTSRGNVSFARLEARIEALNSKRRMPYG
jgi:hypothetical protein